MSYQAFLDRKARAFDGVGLADVPALPSRLYSWQSHVVQWALQKGRAAIFADCGLGKTYMQVAWADALQVRTLMLAPLCVAEQTVAEARTLGVSVHYARDQHDAADHRLVITNYERLEKFDPSAFAAVVLDESSILKSFNGQTRTALIRSFAETPYRLCCTATPSPNDIAELANHAEFLGLMTRPEFLATWFVHDDAGWRMKRHAVEPFYRWLSSWAVAFRSPADLGADDTAFRLPTLQIREEVLPSTGNSGGSLFPELGVKGIQGRLAARRTALSARVEAVKRMTLTGRQGHRKGCAWIIWCGLNEETDALAEALPEAVNVSGADSYAEKVGAVQAFVSGQTRILISKPKILGFGMNFQHCHHMAFVGLSDSYETYYQCIRRCWRYGQREIVTASIIISEAERVVVENVRRKERAAVTLASELLKYMPQMGRMEVA